MSKRATRLFVVASCMALVAATAAVAQDKPPQMSAEEKTMMEAYAKAATPGQQHKWLASKVGKWDFTGKFWTTPGAPSVTSSGTAERSLMLGGRVLGEKVASPAMMGQPFEGYGLTGYDNTAQEFWGTWSDTMGTGLMTTKGKCDDKGACSYMGQYLDPMTGKTKTSRMVSRDEGPDKELHEFFDQGPDGKEFKSMELVYTRKK